MNEENIIQSRVKSNKLSKKMFFKFDDYVLSHNISNHNSIVYANLN